MASNAYPDDHVIKSEWVTPSKLLQAAEDEDSPLSSPPGSKMPTIHESSEIASLCPPHSPPSMYPVREPSSMQAPQVSRSHLAVPSYYKSRAPSKAPSAMPSNVSGTMLQGRDAPPSMVAGTLLQGRDAPPSMVAGSLLQGRDQAPPPIAPPSFAISRHSTIQAPPPKAFADTKSILASPTDVHMASRQTSFMEMTPDRQKLQEEWAQKQLVKYETGCPDSYKWLRVDGGYQCQGGFHCVTDALLEEGKGGMMAFPQGSSTVWGVDEWKGPYYWDEKIKKWRRAT